MIERKLEERLRAWSPRWRPARFKATLVALVVAAVAVPLGILAVPYLEILNDMTAQPKGKAQGLYGWYQGAGLVVERPPVPGTVPVGGVPAYPAQGPKDEAAAKLAEQTLRNPLPASREVLARGRKIFNVHCIVCHGERAEGNGPIVGPNLFPAPPSLHTEQARGFQDGRIFHVITRGQNKMPSYARELAPEERWSVVHYVRALQRAQRMATGEDGR